MGAFLEADTDVLRDVADRLDPAPARAVTAAATEARGLAPDCGDPLPGCRAFTAAVTGVADRIAAFGAEVTRGIEGYAAAARDSAARYEDADGTGHDTLTAVPAAGGAAWASAS
jgi:hypothetical protein